MTCSDVDSLVQWISDHELKLNVKKCKSLLLSRKRVPTCIQTVVVDGQPLEKVQSYKYLGVLISSNLPWGNHVSNICSRDKKHMGMLYRRFYRDADSNTLRMLSPCTGMLDICIAAALLVTAAQPPQTTLTLEQNVS